MGQQKLDFSAEYMWAKIPVQGKDAILAAVWCGQCRTGVKMMDFSARRVGDALVLDGRCSVCGGLVCRHVEAPDGRPYWAKPRANHSKQSR